MRLTVLGSIIAIGGLVGIDWGLYRPQADRVQAAETELKKVRAQLAEAGQRKTADEQILRTVGSGPDGREITERFAGQRTIDYLNSLIDESGLSRLDFRTEASQPDAPFNRETYFIALRGRFDGVLSFLKRLETGQRFARVDEFRAEPDPETGQAVIKLRVTAYGLPRPGGTIQ